jgi:ribose 5-phosphate isomerase A
MASAARLAAFRRAPADLVPAPTTAIESAKREAARRAIDDYVRPGMAVGVGSGSTIVYAIQRLAERAAEGLSLAGCVPTSFQSKQVRLCCG